MAIQNEDFLLVNRSSAPFKTKFSTFVSDIVHVGTTEPDAERVSSGSAWLDTTNDGDARLKVWDGTEWIEVNAEDPIIPTVSTETTPPANPSDGDLWWDSSIGTLFIYYVEDDYNNGLGPGTAQWVEASPGAGGDNEGGANISTDVNPPTDPTEGDLWFNPNTGTLYIYYHDADSQQWVEIAGPGGEGGDGANVTVGPNPPTGAVAGDLWYCDTDGRLYIYYTDADSSQWVDASPAGSGGGGGSDYVLPTATAIRLGGIKVGANLSVEADGTLNAADPDGTGQNLQGVTEIGNHTDNDIKVGGTGVDPNIDLNATGSAQFAGTVQVGGDANSGAETGARVFVGGFQAAAETPGSGSRSLWDGYALGNATPTSRIYTDGSAEFKGIVKVQSAPGVTTDLYQGFGGTSQVYALDESGNISLGSNVASAATTTINLNVDGSASFSTGKVNIGAPGHFFAKNSGNDSYFWANWTGPNSKKGIHVSDSDDVLNAKATIASDGSANFSEGRVTINSPANGDAGQEYFKVTDAVNWNISIGNDRAEDGTVLTRGVLGTQSSSAGTASWGIGINGTTAGHASRATAAVYNDKITIGTDPFDSPKITLSDNGRIDMVGDGSLQQRLRVVGTGTNSLIQMESGGDCIIGAVSEELYFSTDIGNGRKDVTINTDGSVTFQGEINTNNDDGIASDNAVSIKNARVYSRNDSGSVSTNAFAVFKGGDANSNIVAAIKGDGSANFVSGTTRINSVGSLLVGTTSDLVGDAKIALDSGSGGASFAGDVIIGPTNVLSDTANGVRLLNAGTITAQRQAAQGTSTVFTGMLGDDATSSILADGSAEFAGGAFKIGAGGWSVVNTGTYYSWYNQDSSGEQYLFAGGNNSNIDLANVKLKLDGSASFAGSVDVGDFTDANGGVQINNYGVYIRGKTDNVKRFVIYSGGSSATNETTRIDEDGSASFAGNITSGNGTYTGIGSVLQNNGKLYLESSVGDTSTAFQITNPVDYSNPTVNINHDGSASFAGTVKQGTFNGGQTTASGSVLIDGGGVMTQFEASTTAADNRAFVVYHGGDKPIEFKGDGSAHFAGNVTSDGTIGFNLEPDNPANFNAEGEYTGPSLDVKDRLTDLIDALTSLKTAAAASTDHAELKAAIASALTNF